MSEHLRALCKYCACHEICTSSFKKMTHLPRFTNYCACHEISISRFTKHCACHGICDARFTKRCAGNEICTSRFTKRFACHEICASRFTQSAAPVTNSARRGSQSAVPATKSSTEPHVEKLRLTAPVTKSEHLEDHHHVHPKCCTCHEICTVEVKPLRSLASVTKSRLCTTKTQVFPCACHEK